LVVKRSSTKKGSAAPRKTQTKSAKGKKSRAAAQSEQVVTKKSNRPENEVVVYEEHEFELREIPSQGERVLIGPPWLTRFERARITGSRSLQLSVGAPSLIKAVEGIANSIALAIAEIEHKALPISIRRVLPNGIYQDIPIGWMR